MCTLAPIAAPVVTIVAARQSINVFWMILNCQDRHGNIIVYEVRYTSSDNVNQTLNTSSGSDTSLLVEGLEKFTNYTIEMRAYTSVGPGPYSSSMNIRTLPDRKHII